MWSGFVILIPMAIGAVGWHLVKVLPEVFKDEGLEGPTVAQSLLSQRSSTSKNVEG